MIRLGMIGTGRIAQRFAEAVGKVENVQLVCVYNPHEESAEHFVASVENEVRKAPVATASWKKLMEMTDAIYVASPHETHYKYIKTALIENKHVLCEKPMTLCAQEAQEVYDLAEKQNCVLLEAIKTAYCPGFLAMIELAQSGVIGEICDVEACFTKLVSTNMREYTDIVCGGSLTELGSYSLLPIMKLLGTDYQDVNFQSVYAPNGVDKFTKVSFTYPNGMGLSKTGIGVKSEGELIISGTKGYIYCGAPWWLTKHFEVRYENAAKRDVYEYEYEGSGLQYELNFFARKICGKDVNMHAGITKKESVMTAGIMERYLVKNRFNNLLNKKNCTTQTFEKGEIQDRKIRIAVWGITGAIWDSLKKTLDSRKMKILFFIDNNLQRKDESYGECPVYGFDIETLKLLEQVDYVLVAAYSGYQKIRMQLVAKEYPESKVQLYVTEDICRYDLGDVLCDIKLIDRIYFEPEKMKQTIKHYYKVYESYKKMPCLAEDTVRWYEKGTFISHACGGYVNDRKIMYTNSAEALECSLNAGYSLIECDIMRDKSGQIILAHDYEKVFISTYKKYTIQTIGQMIEKIKSYHEVQMLIDVNWNSEQDYANYVIEIWNTIRQVSKTEKESNQLKKQIVMEVYNEATIRYAQAAGFDMFFTQYRNSDIGDYMNTAILCGKYNIGAVGFPCAYISSHKSLISIFNKKNIKIFVYSTDDMQEYTSLKEIGIQGVFTNYLSIDQEKCKNL